MNSENSQLLEILKLIDRLELRLKKLEEKIPETFDIFYKPPEKKEHQKLSLSLDELYAKINRIETTINDGR